MIFIVTGEGEHGPVSTTLDPNCSTPVGSQVGRRGRTERLD